MDWFCQGYGFGEIELAYLLSEEVGLTAEEVFALRAEGMGWGNIRKELGAAPGLGNDKPGRGNDRDNNAPPGLEKKDDDWSPPGQEKNNGANGGHVPPGQAKQRPIVVATATATARPALAALVGPISPQSPGPSPGAFGSCYNQSSWW